MEQTEQLEKMKEQNPVLPEKDQTKRLVFNLCFILFAVVMAYQFFDLLELSRHPLATLLYSCALFTGTLIYALLIGARLGADSIVSGLIGIIVSSYYYLIGRPLTWSFDTYYPCFLLTLIAYAYFAYTLFGNRTAKWFGWKMLLEWLQATVLYPFECFPVMFRVIFGKKRGSVRWKPIIFTLIGILLALLLGFAVIVLLSFDPHFSAFADWVRGWFDIDMDQAFEIVLKLMIAIPLAALLFGMVYASFTHRHQGFASDHTIKVMSEKFKVLPFVIVALPAAMLIVIYGAFFFSQLPYYLSAFSHTLPAEYSAADYARNGFFELCGVAAINAVLCFLLKGLTRRRSGFSEKLLTVLVLLLSAETLVLILTALSKMYLYMERFDLTLSRLWPTFFLFFLLLGFIALILSTFCKKVRVLPVLMTMGVLFAAVYPFCNVNRLVARYNVNAYFQRVQEQSVVLHVDCSYLSELGEAAVPELVRLYESDLTEPTVRWEAEKALKLAAKENPLWNQEADEGFGAVSLHTKTATELLAKFRDD